MIIIVMGVAGVGKTTIGSMLAEQLGWQFFDADNFHPPENVQKMANNIPLTDEDRLPWLHALHGLIVGLESRHISAVIACSALKASYRHILVHGVKQVYFVYLKAPVDVVADRLRTRRGHYMGVALLTSQFLTLEEPEDALIVDATQSPQDIVMAVTQALGLSTSSCKTSSQ
ncbi:MAG TPA: gluconokinase [Armatimonadota bacterium]|nr:gluconokinase [Armatimonadota bacterium]